MTQIAKSDGHYINKLSEAFFNGTIDKLSESTLFPKKNKPDGRKKAEERRARRNAKRAANRDCICLKENGKKLKQCNECPR